MKPLDLLVRRVTVDGHVAPDSRLVIRSDGAAALVTNAGGAAVPAALGTAQNWESHPDGRLVVYLADSSVWSTMRDTRCGSCGGRHQLKLLDVSALFPVPEEPAPSYQDTY